MHAGTRLVLSTSITFFSSIIPIHTELSPRAWAASCAYAAARVASWTEDTKIEHILDFAYQFGQFPLWFWMQHLLRVAYTEHACRDKVGAQHFHHLLLVYHSDPH